MARMTSRRWVLLATGAAAAVAIGAIGIPVTSSRAANAHDAHRSAQESPLPECPTRWTTIPRWKNGQIIGTVTVPEEGFLVTGEITNVPEFHDCQKLLVSSGRQFGPLVAVFASYDLDSLWYRIDTIEHVSSAQRRGAVAGLILNLQSTYAGLDIKPGFSCLFLWYDPANPVPSPWRARIVAVENDDEQCAQPFKPGLPLPTDLEVQTDAPPGLRSDTTQFPAVARWDWDDSTKQHYIGIRCGQSWCEVGKPRFRRSRPYSTTVTTPPGTPAVQRIKGWYDEQFLAVQDAEGVLSVSNVKGTIFPDPQLRTRVEADFRRRWLAVAYVALSAPSRYYLDKFNFESVPPGSPLSLMNRLSFCRGTRSECQLPPRAQTPTTRVCDTAWPWPSERRKWWVRIESPSGTRPPLYRCVIRRDHGEVEKDIPSTTRWRWLADDETQWIECNQGCCQTQTSIG